MIPRRAVATILVLALASAGCLVSGLQPLYDAESIVFDEALLGTWTNRESEVGARITRGEWRSYQVAYTDRFGTTTFTAHLTTVGTGTFLNLRPEDGLERPAFLVATNGILQVALARDTVRVRELDYATFIERLKAGTLKLPAAIDLKQNVLITADTPLLRKWLGASMGDDALFADWKTFVRSSR